MKLWRINEDVFAASFNQGEPVKFTSHVGTWGDEGGVVTHGVGPEDLLLAERSVGVRAQVCPEVIETLPTSRFEIIDEDGYVIYRGETTNELRDSDPQLPLRDFGASEGGVELRFV